MTMNCKILGDYQRWSRVLSRNFHPSPPSFKKKMAPKKAAAPEKKILLGRPSNNLKIGIVGTCQPSRCLLLSHPHHRLAKRRKIIILQRVVQHRSVPPPFVPYLLMTDRQPLQVIELSPFSVSTVIESLLDLGKAFNYPFATIEPEVILIVLLSFCHV